jgi:membrane protease YdiL (CAAX protease family)
MKYRDCATFTVEKFRKKLTVSLACTLGIFLVTAVILVIEVYALLALQFCDGEDLMSLYWATWTMLQLGSEIAILGVSLALWHHLWDMEHP